jgi:preprotein translocase subunit SecA
MDHLKEGINLRSYGQKDPLVEYKREAFLLYEQMKEEVRRAVVERLFAARLYSIEEIEEIKKHQQALLEAQLDAHRNAQADLERVKELNNTPIKRKTIKVGRNDVCPCGSGKKFKHCHGA